LRAEIIRLHHDVLAVGHGGRWKTVELVTVIERKCGQTLARVRVSRT